LLIGQKGIQGFGEFFKAFFAAQDTGVDGLKDAAVVFELCKRSWPFAAPQLDGNFIVFQIWACPSTKSNFFLLTFASYQTNRREYFPTKFDKRFKENPPGHSQRFSRLGQDHPFQKSPCPMQKEKDQRLCSGQ
ncbi:MAG: hypothetical protein AAFV25_21960, partial [Bacteroidota bacterium]